jgi:hypothetical protein
MPTPNGQRNPLETPRTGVVELFAKLTGGGVGADLVNSDSAVNGGGEIVSAVWSSTGTYTVTFRKAWPQLLFAPIATFVGATQDFNLQCSAIDVAAQTATFVFGSNTTPTDVATTTTCYVRWTVRSSGKN